MKKTALTELKNGEKAVVTGINGGGQLVHRLNSMGVFPGKEITKRFSSRRGPVIIEVLRSKVAIGRGMAEKIMVQRVP
ncbi:MAG: ferrous iron transport protein A [Elusimicrobia bacterium CG08_land_8_20_14_0_20_51_18]|nr:MAG: ferrous iron transport protein A [Elusimicrobia bacterium CG08_land_8_20_14_0_20_51_18]